MKAVLIKKSTGEVIKIGKYPSAKIEEIVGLDANLEWYAWVKLEKPTYNPETERLEKVESATTNTHPTHSFLKTYEVSFNVVAMTQKEQDDYKEQAESMDNAAMIHSERKQDGSTMFDKFYAKVIRQKLKGNLTTVQAKKFKHDMYPILNPLNVGLWKLVKSNLNAATPPTNAKLLALFDLFKAKVAKYITDNY